MREVETSTPVEWSEELRTALRTAEDLVAWDLISPEEIPRYAPVLARYKFLLPQYYARLIDPKDPRCPIRLQAIPSPLELERGPGVPDPLHDFHFRPAPRVTQRFAGRMLLHLTFNCSMYCRFCFRKSHLNESRADFFEGEIAEAMDHLRNDTTIEEVIFSGGDPWMASDDRLDKILSALNEISHLQRIRFHTRVPVTLPSRVTPALCDLFSKSSIPITVVTHFNHPKELTFETACAIQFMKPVATILNQSVLLRGVNDSAAILKQLSVELFSQGVLPYYLHHPDEARGTQHFSISRMEGIAIYERVRSELSGYLVPRYVIDEGRTDFKPDVRA